MDRNERIYALHRIFRASRYPVPLARLKEELGCSRATLYRDLAYLRDALGAPLDSDPEHHTWSYASDEAERFELPGLWLSAEELKALLVLYELLGRADPGLLSDAVAPLKSRIESLLAAHGAEAPTLLARVRILRSGRNLDPPVFRQVASTVLEARQLWFRYTARSTDERTERVVSPQRLTYYRDNWYLDAWCHRRQALRSFSLDRIREPRSVPEATLPVSADQLDQHLASTYGIFAGEARHTAVIRFSAHAARWAAEQHWHSRQQGQFLSDGRYELRLPYGRSTELLMDLMRYGPDAEVIAPAALRQQMAIRLRLTLANYGSGGEAAQVDQEQ